VFAMSRCSPRTDRLVHLPSDARRCEAEPRRRVLTAHLAVFRRQSVDVRRRRKMVHGVRTTERSAPNQQPLRIDIHAQAALLYTGRSPAADLTFIIAALHRNAISQRPDVNED